MKSLKFVLTAILLGAIFSGSCSDKRSISNTHIAVYYPYLNEGDKMTIYYAEKPTISDQVLKDYNSASLNFSKDGWYHFSFRIEKTSDIFIQRQSTVNSDSSKKSPSNDNLLVGYFADKGDDIKISISKIAVYNPYGDTKNLRYTFSGKGALKYAIKSKSDIAGYNINDSTLSITSDHHFNPSNFNRVRLKAELEVYQANRNRLSPDDLMRAVASLQNREGLAELRGLYYRWSDLCNKLGVATVVQIYKEYFAHPINLDWKLPDTEYLRTTNYAPFLLQYALLQLMTADKTKNADSLYTFIKNNYCGKVRDRAIYSLISGRGYALKRFDQIYDDALQIVTNPQDLEFIKRYGNRHSMVNAFDFALPDAQGKIMHLSDFKGKAVFIDFWFTGCGNCVDFYKHQLKKVEEKYKEDNSVVFISICIDKSRSTWLSSVDSDQYTSNNCVNLFTNGEGSASDVIRFYNVNSYPQPVLITRKQQVYSLEAAKLRNESSLIKSIEELRK